MGSLGRRASTMLPTRRRCFPPRNPNDSATGDSPSRMRNAPRSTRSAQLWEAGVAVRSTKTLARSESCRTKPTEESICGQAPTSRPITAKCSGGSAANATQAIKLPSNSARNRIPEPRTYIEKIRPPVKLRNQVSSPQSAHREQQRPRHPRRAKTNPRTGFHIIGPVEPLGVTNQIAVPEKLGQPGSQPRRGQPDPGLPVQQQIVLEPAHVNPIGIG